MFSEWVSLLTYIPILCTNMHNLCMSSALCILMAVLIPSPTPALSIVIVFWLVALNAFWSVSCYLGVSCAADGQGGRTTLTRRKRVDNWSHWMCFPSFWSVWLWWQAFLWCVYQEAWAKQRKQRPLIKLFVCFIIYFFLKKTIKRMKCKNRNCVNCQLFNLKQHTNHILQLERQILQQQFMFVYWL